MWHRKHNPEASLTYLLLLYLGLHHFELSRWWLLIGHKLLGVHHPAEQGLQGILEPPAVQQGLLQLGCSLSHLQSASWSYLFTSLMKQRKCLPATTFHVYLPIWSQIFFSFSFKVYPKHRQWTGCGVEYHQTLANKPRKEGYHHKQSMTKPL